MLLIFVIKTRGHHVTKCGVVVLGDVVAWFIDGWAVVYILLHAVGPQLTDMLNHQRKAGAGVVVVLQQQMLYAPPLVLLYIQQRLSVL